MSFLWGPSPGQVEFDALLDKTTSSLLPSSTPPDLLASLHLADLIRSSALPPLNATKSLLRRLRDDNPNVQLLTLTVLDIAIKNGGTPFLLVVSNDEMAKDLESLGRGGATVNRDVRERVLAKLQDWATAFAQKDNLKGCDLVRYYDKMKSEGLPFPPRDPTATAAMVDSLSAPEWTDASYCTRCRTDFSTFNRKHHCRNCGSVFDQQCSSQTSPLPHYGITESVRVCDDCVKKIKEGKGVTGVKRSNSVGVGGSERPGSPGRSSTVSYSTSDRKLKAEGRKSKEDEDLQRAIEASLREVNGSAVEGPAFQLRNPPSNSAYNPSYSSIAPDAPAKPAPAPSATKEEEEDDPDLAAAIAASLRDVAPPPSAPTYNDEGPAATYASLYHSPPPPSAYPSLPTPRLNLPSYDLTPLESTTLHTFSSTLSRPPPHGLGENERRLYEEASKAGPRLERGLQDAERRREILGEMEGKLSEAARLYRGLLEVGAQGREAYPSNSYHSTAQYQPQQHQPQPQQSYYPTPVPPAPYQQQQYAPHPSQSPYSASQQQQQYAYAPPPPTHGQPLPSSTYSQPAAAPQPLPLPSPSAVPQPQPQPQPQPAGVYYPSQFPSVPTGPAATLPMFPHVPSEGPWERERERQEREREKEEEGRVGELIEL
ncbi:hypothetical protein BCR35DRAFT_300729 [Leucosporidium creatinivorum]|uniref:Vacuolar protein sorting-associated protein 27 n=1 Tax=Leucosporidium creatinivorum TaxID=106004 RepID=A0A1Y2FY20_9BASI|nr:hypothetical protein BCR35DRAFT_300729 [Leucosporidium creatinivorum]